MPTHQGLLAASLQPLHRYIIITIISFFLAYWKIGPEASHMLGKYFPTQ